MDTKPNVSVITFKEFIAYWGVEGKAKCPNTYDKWQNIFHSEERHKGEGDCKVGNIREGLMKKVALESTDGWHMAGGWGDSANRKS